MRQSPMIEDACFIMQQKVDFVHALDCFVHGAKRRAGVYRYYGGYFEQNTHRHIGFHE